MGKKQAFQRLCAEPPPVRLALAGKPAENRNLFINQARWPFGKVHDCDPAPPQIVAIGPVLTSTQSVSTQDHLSAPSTGLTGLTDRGKQGGRCRSASRRQAGVEWAKWVRLARIRPNGSKVRSALSVWLTGEPGEIQMGMPSQRIGQAEQGLGQMMVTASLPQAPWIERVPARVAAGLMQLQRLRQKNRVLIRCVQSTTSSQSGSGRRHRAAGCNSSCTTNSALARQRSGSRRQRYRTDPPHVSGRHPARPGRLRPTSLPASQLPAPSLHQARSCCSGPNHRRPRGGQQPRSPSRADGNTIFSTTALFEEPHASPSADAARATAKRLQRDPFVSLQGVAPWFACPHAVAVMDDGRFQARSRSPLHFVVFFFRGIFVFGSRAIKRTPAARISRLNVSDGQTGAKHWSARF